MYGYIYKITNTVNNKIYIGLTKRNPQYRWKEHLRGSHNIHLLRAENIYGLDKFSFEILDTANTPQELLNKERYWISRLDATNHDIGYNISSGGCGPNGIKWSNESRQKVSQDRLGSKWFHKDGKHKLVRKEFIHLYTDWEPGYGPGRTSIGHSEETKRKIKESNIKTKSNKSIKDKQIKAAKWLATYTANKHHWYTNGLENLNLKETDSIPEGFYPGRTVAHKTTSVV